MLPIKKIVCPLDFSGPATHALQAACDLAGQFSSELIAVHVVMVPMITVAPQAVRSLDPEAYLKKETEKARELLEETIRRQGPEGCAVRLVVLHGDPAQEIVRFAGREKADLIVIATRGAGGWRGLVFGSVARKVVRLARRPVLVVRQSVRRETENTE